MGELMLCKLPPDKVRGVKLLAEEGLTNKNTIIRHKLSSVFIYTELIAS